jgi:hypothetical protein
MFACAPFVKPYRALYEGGVLVYCMLLPEVIQMYCASEFVLAFATPVLPLPLTIGIFGPVTHLSVLFAHSTGSEAVPSGNIASLLVLPDTVHRYRVLYWEFSAASEWAETTTHKFKAVALAVACLMEPVPRTQTPARGALGHALRNLVDCLAEPSPGVINRDDCEVVGVDVLLVAGICDPYCRAAEIVVVGRLIEFVSRMQRAVVLQMSPS